MSASLLPPALRSALCLLFILLAAAPPAQADSVVVPNAYVTTEGNSYAVQAQGEYRYQQVYDASQFPGIMWITGTRVRPDASQPGPGSVSYAGGYNYVSVTTRTAATLSPNFDSNPGPNRTLIGSGPGFSSTANQPGPGSAKQFDFGFDFDFPIEGSKICPDYIQSNAASCQFCFAWCS